MPHYSLQCGKLQTCLDSSVLGQTYQNLEIILINYGSIDNSDAICRSYVARLHSLFLKRINGGLDARHIGIPVRLRELRYLRMPRIVEPIIGRIFISTRLTRWI